MKDINLYVEESFRNTKLESSFSNLLSGNELLEVLQKYVNLEKNEVILNIGLEVSHNSFARYEVQIFNTETSTITEKAGYMIKERLS